jgi:hypothetical protein
MSTPLKSTKPPTKLTATVMFERMRLTLCTMSATSMTETLGKRSTIAR